MKPNGQRAILRKRSPQYLSRSLACEVCGLPIHDGEGNAIYRNDGKLLAGLAHRDKCTETWLKQHPC